MSLVFITVVTAIIPPVTDVGFEHTLRVVALEVSHLTSDLQTSHSLERIKQHSQRSTLLH